MAYQYRNRRGHVYLLQMGKTRKGNDRYYFGRKLTGTPVEEIPAGYEVYESPERGQVFLRKIRPSAISEVERELVAEKVRDHLSHDTFAVEVEGNSLVVWLPTQSLDQADAVVRKLAGPDALQSQWFRAARDQMHRDLSYEKLMRFELIDEDERLFAAYRWCFRGSIDDWLPIAGPGLLSDHLEVLVKRLGTQSFFELF